MPSADPPSTASRHHPGPIGCVLVSALVLAGCREIRVEPGEQVDTTGASSDATSTSGAGGGVPATTGLASSSSGDPGAGGAGGGPGSGGAAPVVDPVPGCEELVWVGEPLVIPVGPWPTPRLATLDDGDVGLIVADRDHPGAHALVSFVVDQPFARWPPALSAPTVVLLASHDGYGNGDFWNEDPRLSARGDGTYAVSVPGQPTGTAGVFGNPPDGLVFEGHLTLDPTAGGAAHRILWLEEGAVLDRFASLLAGATPTRVGQLPANDCWGISTVVTVDGTFVVAAGSSPYCDGDTSIDIIRADGDGIASVASLPVAEDTWQHELVPRPGGAWLLVVDADGVTATALAGDGAPTGASWAWERPEADGRLAAAPWREGFALAEVAHVGDVHGVRVRVSDGVHGTASLPLPEGGVATRGLSVVASADGSSLLVAHEVLQDLWVQRADCLSPASPP